MKIRVSKGVKLHTPIDFLNFALLLLAFSFLSIAFFKADNFVNILRIISLIMLIVVNIWSGTLNRRDVYLFFIAAFVLLSNGTVSLNIAFLIILGVALNKVSFQKSIHSLNLINWIIVAVVLFSLLTGIVDNYVWTYLGRTRNTLGFVHANNAGILNYSVVVLSLMSCKRIKWYHYFVTLLISYFIFDLTDSRTGFLCILIFLFSVIIVRFLSYNMIKFIYVGVSIFVFATPLMWNLPIINSTKMNQLLSLRPGIFSRYISKHSLKHFLFGGSVIEEIDNFYLLFLYNAGIIIYMLFLISTIIMIVRLINNGKYVLLSFVFSLLIMGMFESSILRPEYLCVPLFWKIVISENNYYFLPKIDVDGDINEG